MISENTNGTIDVSALSLRIKILRLVFNFSFDSVYLIARKNAMTLNGKNLSEEPGFGVEANQVWLLLAAIPSVISHRVYI